MTGDGDVVIIGAPRSGTNMLRDVLTSLPGFATWPCDEINLLWRHGNRDHPSDELGPELATNEVCAYLRGRFDRIRRRYGAQAVVEKTCANSLRVTFVHRVKPEARFVFITRDGLDAASSAMARWDAQLDVRYTAAKARFTPLSDLPYYASRFVSARMRPRRTNSVSTWWGPRTHDAEALMATRPLEEICLIQWQRCVESARADLALLPSSQIHHVTYESFVRDPVAGLRDLVDFLGVSDSFDARAVDGVTDRSIGKGRASLSDEVRGRLIELGRPTLEGLGYVTS